MNTSHRPFASSIARRIPFGVAMALLVSMSTAAQAQVVVLDDFEVNEGRFAQHPGFSGSSQGFEKAATISTADRVTDAFFDGLASQFIFIDDNSTIPGSPQNLDSWRMRHLSGSGTATNNFTLGVTPGNTSYVGYWLKTNTPGLEAGISIDDGITTVVETVMARWQTIPADGQWHLFEWQLQDPNDWDVFAGLTQNGQIDSATAAIDGIFVRGGVGVPTGGDFNASFHIDRVAYNAVGSVVPEPASAGLLGLSALLLSARRRRTP